MKRLFRWSFGLGLMGMMASTCCAAELWLIPERFEATPGATLQLEVRAIDLFESPSSAAPIPVATVDYALSQLGNRKIDVRTQDIRGGGAGFSITLQQPGVALVAVGLKPSIMQMSAEELGVELRKLHMGRPFQDEVKARVGERRARVGMRTHAKVFVRVGLPVEADRDWERAMGTELELVPGQNPTSLRAGSSIRVKVWHRGAAVPQVAVNFRTVDGSQQHVAYTDAEGWAEANLGVAGTWLVDGSILQFPSDSGELDLAIEQATLTIEVQ
jgi:Domain of unknown function (DUF4198)